MRPDGTGRNGVLLLGEALGEQEAIAGRPFQGRAGQVFNKLLSHAGFSRDDFLIANSVWCRPPKNKLEGQPYEYAAVSACASRHVLPLVQSAAPRCIVPMGNVPMWQCLGQKSILSRRGYVYTGGRFGSTPVLPTVHPSFIMRGQGAYGTVFIRDIQRAVEVAAVGYHPAHFSYLLDPGPADFLRYVEEYEAALASDPSTLLSYDIETPYADEEKEEGGVGDDDTTDASYTILRCSFSFRPYSACSVPFSGPYIPLIRRLLSSRGAKVVWNDSFDSPRLAASGCPVRPPIHDGMVAWHLLNSDLPKRLGFVASMLLEDQPEWKSLNKAQPAFYSASDPDVALRCLLKTFRALEKNGLWSLYERHIVRLFPLLARLSDRGMPIDNARREEFAMRLSGEWLAALNEMEDVVPHEARTIAHVYAGAPPKGVAITYVRPGKRQVYTCSRCFAGSPTKAHFRTIKRPTAKRPQNPCAGATKVLREVDVVEHYRLHPFRPSPTQLQLYCQVRKIKPPRARRDDGSWGVTFNEDAIRRLALQHPEDKLFPIILKYRKVDKLAGTYIGRPLPTSGGEGGPHPVSEEEGAK